MVDVGANYVYYSCLWASVRSDNRVIAFEASPRNFLMLSSNLERNMISPQVQAHELAIGKKAGTLNFDLGLCDQSGWGRFCTERTEHTVEVAVVSLDEFFKNQNSFIDVLKIDTEGADAWVVEGGMGLLKAKKIKNIFFEKNDVRMSKLGISFKKTLLILTQCGYEFKRIDTNEWYAWLTTKN